MSTTVGFLVSLLITVSGCGAIDAPMSDGGCNSDMAHKLTPCGTEECYPGLTCIKDNGVIVTVEQCGP